MGFETSQSQVVFPNAPSGGGGGVTPEQIADLSGLMGAADAFHLIESAGPFLDRGSAPQILTETGSASAACWIVLFTAGGSDGGMAAGTSSGISTPALRSCSRRLAACSMRLMCVPSSHAAGNQGISKDARSVEGDEPEKPK